MNKDEYEGSSVLEILAQEGLIDDFYEAVDSDNIEKAISVMRKAQIEEDVIELTIRQILDE